MRTKNTKRTLFIYKPYECTAVEEYLGKMSDRGWLLQSVKGSWFKFKKIEPKKIKYSVDVLDKVSIFDHKDSNVALEYREYCYRAGWNYVCQTGKIQIFYTEGDQEISPIHTDANEKFKAVFKSSLYSVGSQLFLAIVFLFNIYLQLVWNDTSFYLASNLMIFSTLVMLFAIFIHGTEAISFFRWVIKAKRGLKENKFMPYNSYKQLKRKNILIKIYISIIIFILVKFTVFDTSWSKEVSVMLLMMIFIPIVIMICAQYFIDKKRYSKNTNMVITIGSTIVSFYLILIVVGVIAFWNITKAEQNEVTTDKASLTLKDFGYKENNYESPHIDLYKSVLAQSERYYYGNEENILNYEILQSQYPWVIKFHQERLIGRLNKYGADLNEENADLSSDIKVYSDSEGSEIILVSENKVVYIKKHFSDIGEDEFLNRVYKIFFDYQIIE
jgi:hypothetical protein